MRDPDQRRNAPPDLVLRPTMKRTLPTLGAACAVLAASACAAEARPSNFDLAPPPGAASAAGGDVVSKPLRAPKRFNLVGLRWAGGGEPEVWVRARRANGAWSRWAPAAAHADHGPDPGRGERRGRGFTDPVWVGSAD